MGYVSFEDIFIIIKNILDGFKKNLVSTRRTKAHLALEFCHDWHLHLPGGGLQGLLDDQASILVLAKNPWGSGRFAVGWAH